MKNNYLYALFMIIGLLLIYLIADNVFFPVSTSYNTGEESIIKYEDNILYVNYSKLNDFLGNVNDYLYYSDDLENIYNDIVDKYYKDKKAKMYDEKNYKVLELKYDKEEAESLFKNYIKVNDDVTVKVVFKNDEQIKNIDIDAIDLKLNRDEVIRKRMVRLAQQQVGNTGETYWEWYGFDHRVEWCCVFVSWLANQNGVLKTDIPKFIWVKKGVDYFKSKNELKFPNEYTPRAGDIIFFDWNNNLVIDHVGIVEKVEGNYVYSIEGNVGKVNVQRRKSKLNSYYIYAYGVPDYSN